jgi:L-threonylcarbamoyladenylate synthase
MTILLKIDPRRPDRQKIAAAVAVLKDGGVLAYPTETFYGLGADASNESAVETIFTIKGRAFDKPISVIIADEKSLDGLAADVPDGARELMKRFWPGPLTIVFKAAPFVSSRLTAKTGKIGVRVSSHPLAALLAGELGAPLTATSANLSGQDETISATDVKESLGDLPDMIIDAGETPGGSGSTILDVTVFPFRILREGTIPARNLLG